MDRMTPRSIKKEQSVDNHTPVNLGHGINPTGARRGQTSHQGIAMEQIANPSESSFGRTPGSRSNDDHETDTHPMDFYHPFFQTDMGQTLATTTQDNHVFAEQPPMVDQAGNDYENHDSVPRHPSGGYPLRILNYFPMDNGFGLPAQDADDGHHSSNTASAVTNAYSQDLQPGNHDTPASNGHVERTPESSTIPEDVTRGTSPSPPVLLPGNSGSQEPCMSVWNPAGSSAPVGRNRKRRKMTDEELVRNRALKAAGGACDACRRRKKKCRHKDDQLILSAPGPTPGPAPAPAQAPVSAPTSAPVLNGSSNAINVLTPCTRLVRPRPDDINRRAAPVGRQHQRQHNPSVSSYGRTLDPSMFSPSDGGASSNGTMTSTQSDATAFAVDEHHPEIRAEEQFGMNTAGFGYQFNGQLAQSSIP